MIFAAFHKPSALITAATTAALLLTGCATKDDARFPSLAKRPIEDMGLTRIPDAVEPPPAPAADGALVGRIAELRGQIASGEARFRAELARAQAKVSAAGGAAPASDAWMEAQMAISGVEAARRPSVEGLASLDQLKVSRERDNLRAGTDELDAAITAGRATVEGQSATLTALKRRLRPI